MGIFADFIATGVRMRRYSIAVYSGFASPRSMPDLPSRSDGEQQSWLARLRGGLSNTRAQLAQLFTSAKIDPATMDRLEAALLASDAGVDATRYLVSRLREQVPEAATAEQAKAGLRAILVELLAPLEQALRLPASKPCVIMLAGVNGAGKTTSIGKLAKYFRDQGHSVLLAAGDTFRAAAREQLQAWAERNSVAIVAQSGGDPAAVVYDAVAAARARGIDILLADTAGRLSTQLHLMEEIRKIKRVIAKAEPGAPHEVWLVLDANTGQNALKQVRAFDDALGVTGLVLTKLDGTAKGGIVIAIARRLGLPIRFIGIGEQPQDFGEFDARAFAAALVEGPREPAQ
jgi:fused signal recognition particle receptor